MNIALVGYGHMGRMLHAMSVKQGHNVVAIIAPHSTDDAITAKEVTKESLQGADLVLEFAHSEGIEQRINTYAETGIPTVIATTGWFDRLNEIEKQYANTNASIIWSGNFAIGVHLFFSIVRYATQIFNPFEQYDSVIQELFHAQKADSPSGTSAMLANIVIQESKHKDEIVSERLDRRRKENEIHIASARGGYSPGVHSLIFDGPSDTIELTHRSKNKESFAEGALQAGTWLQGKKGFFSIDAMLEDVLHQKEN
ncbi:MAG: 4-hydroxy-tetrahydrodipicolinate reductase [Sphaerochaetaceae bacterium]|jgi:4-hydroxy-tetrahydrodipicolinate reductase